MAAANRIPALAVVALMATFLALAPGRAAASQLGLSDEQFLALLQESGFQTGDAMLFLEQNPPGLEGMRLPPQGPPALKAIVYRRISADKYRIVIRGARGAFPLLFGEAFHHQWKLYPVPPPVRSEEALRHSLEVLAPSPTRSPQATANELASLVDQGIVQDLGQGEHPAYVSRLIRQTVQNDNLEIGSLLETWSLPSLGEDRHLTANGYANLWVIDPEQVRTLVSRAVVDNQDGSVDMAFVLEFHQRYVRLYGIAVSLGTLAATLLLLMVRALWRHKRAKAV